MQVIEKIEEQPCHLLWPVASPGMKKAPVWNGVRRNGEGLLGHPPVAISGYTRGTRVMDNIVTPVFPRESRTKHSGAQRQVRPAPGDAMIE